MGTRCDRTGTWASGAHLWVSFPRRPIFARSFHLERTARRREGRMTGTERGGMGFARYPPDFRTILYLSSHRSGAP